MCFARASFQSWSIRDQGNSLDGTHIGTACSWREALTKRADTSISRLSIWPRTWSSGLTVVSAWMHRSVSRRVPPRLAKRWLSTSLGRQQVVDLREACAPRSRSRNCSSTKGGTDTVVYRAAYSDYFHTNTKAFPAIEFLVELLQHLPDPRSRLIRTYGLYSSRARGTWSRSPSSRCRPGKATPHGPA
jgi:hypothetical protein